MIYKLKALREDAKILENAPQIYIDIPLPLDREDYEFLKQMNEMGISVKGRYILNNQIIGFYDNGVMSVETSGISLY